MIDSAYKTLLIDNPVHICTKDGMVIVKNNDKVLEFSIKLINTIIIANNESTITTGLLNELNKNNISVIFCNEKKLPISFTSSLIGNNASVKRLFEQINWNNSCKDLLWTDIIALKLYNCANLLSSINKTTESEKIKDLIQMLELGDLTNREAVGAKIYFHALFGNTFNRDKQDDINAALDYGYAILTSHISRYISSMGFSTAIGIHHNSMTNPNNLTYDLIEPFRVFVDKMVYDNKNEQFNNIYKQKLINICNTEIKYNNKKYLLGNAINDFCNECFKSLNTGKIELPEISFYQ